MTGTGGLAARVDEFAGVRRNVELRPIRGLDEAARLGLRPVEPSREGLLGVEAAVEVLRLGDVAFPEEGLPLLPPERANGLGFRILLLPLILALPGFWNLESPRCFAILRPLSLSSSVLLSAELVFWPSVVSGVAVLLTC